MQFLLDTQAFLWFVLQHPSLSQVACDLIVDPLNDILLSPASYWEIAVPLMLNLGTTVEQIAESLDLDIELVRSVASHK